MKQFLLVFLIASLLLPGLPVAGEPADASYQSMPFSEAWNNTNLITTNDDWSGVPGVLGFRGDSLTSSTGVDPQTILAADTPGVVDVIANQTDPGLTTGGVAEYELANPAVALNGSGTADAPYLLLHLNTTGFQDIRVQYNLRDLDDTADNAVQQVALHYRVGVTGNFTNVAAAYVADATTGGTATQVTPVNVVLPTAADNQPQVQLRIMTTNAPGNDEWVGVDDIHITGTPVWVAPIINEFSASTTGADVEYVEVFGSASTDLATCQILELEGDSTSNAGTVDEVIAVGTTDAAGLWLANLAADTLENGTITLLLVKNFSGALGDDLDANDDGVLDTTPWEVMLDAVAVNDGGAGDLTYGTPALGPNYDGLSSFAPGGASRIPDGTDTGAAADWVRNDFDLAGIPGYPGTPVPGEAYNTPGAINQAVPTADAPPTVASTAPANGATDVPVSENVSLTFSESVDVAAEGISIACPAGAPVAFSGLPASDATFVTLNPTAELPYNTICTVTVAAAGVTDNDGTPDPLAADYVFSFTTAAQSLTCTDPDTPIGLIQSAGAVFDPAYGGTQTVQGVVVGDYEGPSPALRGFYVQNPDATDDDNPATSDAIFIFEGDNADRVNAGQVVQVTGTVAEYQGQTQISATRVELCEVTGPQPMPVISVTLPFPSADYLERYEGMLVYLPQTLYVTEHFQLGRFNQVVLAADARLQQPTALTEPGAAALALQAANDLNRIIVDDAFNSQNPDPITFGRNGQPLSATNTLRGGDTVTGLSGVLTYTWSGNAASGNAYRLRPPDATPGKSPNFQPANARPAAVTDPGGTLKVAGMNLLNFFNTFGAGCTNGVGGAATDCRGADSQAEFDRQWPKTVAAIIQTEADIIAFSEIENDGYAPDSAIQTLVAKLNAATAPGTYAFIDADAGAGQVNALGTDAIKVGLLYQPARVTPVGTTAALNSAAFVNGGDSAPRNRPALAQAFAQTNGERLIVLANHFKSKGSACDSPDAGDGQGNCSVVRTNAAAALLAWLATDPTGTGETDVLIMGDLNSYAKEDPIRALEAGGYTNLVRKYGGESAYGYVFDGQWGYLDHALASAGLLKQVTGAVEYHINADEPSVLDYNTDYKTAGQQVSLYAADEFRASDHDPLVVGLALGMQRIYLPLIARQSAATPPMATLSILVDDFSPQPYQGETYYAFNRRDGDRGSVNNSVLTWGRGQVTTTVAAGTTWGGGWLSLNHPLREQLALNFSAILPAPILPAYQSRITGLTAQIVTGTPGRTFRLELKDRGALRWAGEIVLAGGEQTARFALPDLANVNELVWVLDQAAGGDNVVLDSIAFTATTQLTDIATAAFTWSYGQLLNNWNPATGLVRDKARAASGEFDAVQATGSLAAATAQAEQLGIIARADAIEIVNKIGATLLEDLPRFHGLLPHWTSTSPTGAPAIVWGTEWSSVDTVIAALGLLTAQQALGLETANTQAMLDAVDWAALALSGGISHGYTYAGALLPYAWDVFGGESWLVELAYAAAEGQVAPLTYPAPPTANGAGFIDELAWLFAPPPAGPDYWGTDWPAYRAAAADRQIDYYPTQYPASCLAQLGLFGLSAAETPDPALVAPANIYQAFGVGGRFAGANDGAALLGAPVAIPHYAALLASLRPDAALRMWAWLSASGFVTPLNNVESLLLPVGVACEPAGVVWNQLQGSWNLALQTLGWGRYLAERRGQVPVLWQAAMANTFLRDGYDLLAPGGPTLP